MPAPTEPDHATNKGYVDDLVASLGGSRFHLLAFTGSWPDRPDDDVPAIFMGGVAPTDAPADADLRDGDYWLPGSEPGGLAGGGGGGGGTVLWDDIDGKPSMFPPAAHSHGQGDIDGLGADLAGKEPAIGAGTAMQYWRGDKTWQPLNKAAVGLGNVNNTADADKPVSTATQTALDLKANAAGLSAVATSGAYSDLSGRPTLGTAAATDSTEYATAAQGVLAQTAIQAADLDAAVGQLAAVAFSGSYNDLDDKPTGGGGTGLVINPVLANANYTAAAGDAVFTIASGFTVTLPSPAEHGDRIEIVVSSGLSDDITVDYFDLVTQSPVSAGPFVPTRLIFYYGKDIDLGSGPLSGWAQAQ